MSRQLILNLKGEPDHSRAAFIVSESNRAAVELLDSPERWHGRALALVGPEGSGKSHLATDWARRHRGLIFDARSVLEEAAGRVVVWDDADELSAGDEETLFHLINMAANRNGLLLLTGASPPRAWSVALPDLRSRLNALTVAQMAEPDEPLMVGLLEKLFRERHIRPADDLFPYLLKRMPRSAAAARTLVTSLDTVAGEEGRPITRALARRVLEPDTDDD